MIYCTGLELHALSSPTGTRYAFGMMDMSISNVLGKESQYCAATSSKIHAVYLHALTSVSFKPSHVDTRFTLHHNQASILVLTYTLSLLFDFAAQSSTVS